jgi:hypothetical protein
MNREKAGLAGVPYACLTEPVESSTSMSGVVCTAWKQCVTVQVSATYDEKCTLYLLLRFCLSLFA